MQIILTRSFNNYSFLRYFVFKIDNHKSNKINNLPVKTHKYAFIFNVSELIQLELNNFTEFNKIYIHKLLKKKCVLFVIYNKRQLIYTAWISTSNLTHKIIDDVSFKFLENKKKYAVWGNAYTHNNYRNLGLNKFALQESINYLSSIGLNYTFSSVDFTNLFSVNSFTKLSHFLKFEFRVIKILFLKIVIK